MKQSTLITAFFLTTVLSGLFFGGCQTSSPDSAAQRTAKVSPAFFSQRIEADNTDSPASWQGADGMHWALATAKETDVVIVMDGKNGRELDRIGGSGSGLGQLERPNGIFVADDLLFVVERDNKRLQVFSLPDKKPLGVFGSEELVKPYGLWVYPIALGIYHVYVTDNYELVEDQVPPDSELGRRIRQYEVTIQGGSLSSKLVRTFGDTSGPGVLRIVESLWGDAANNRLLIAEEEEDASLGGLCVKVYDLEGNFTGTIIGKGHFDGQVEGIALDLRNGYWIITNQSFGGNRYHLFHRKDLSYVGYFEAEAVENTDGIWLDTTPMPPRFPQGIFYAVHDDGNVAGLSWAEVLSALRLK